MLHSSCVGRPSAVGFCQLNFQFAYEFSRKDRSHVIEDLSAHKLCRSVLIGKLGKIVEVLVIILRKNALERLTRQANVNDPIAFGNKVVAHELAIDSISCTMHLEKS